MEKLNCIFMGTPDFSVPTLSAIHNHTQINIVKVVTMPDRKSGRGKKLQAPPVAIYAKENNLPLIQAENINSEEDLLNLEAVDLIIVIAFAQFLGSKVLALPKLGCFNIHTSILPKYRGAAPIQYALLNGDLSTGVSIQRMVKKMDAGDICHFKECSISATETGASLFEKLQVLSAEEITYFINNLIANKITWTAQDERQITFAPSFIKKDGLINANNSQAIDIERKVRAFNPWPGTYCFINNKRIKVLEAQLSKQNIETGKISTIQGTLLLGTIKGSIRLKTIQLAGKKACSDQQFINGMRSSDKDFEFNYSIEEL